MSINIKTNILLKTIKSYLKEEPNKKYRIQINKLFVQAKNGNKNAWHELSNRLLGQLKFGTAGVRGKMQGGYQCINDVTIAKITWAIATYLLQTNKKPSIIIGFDSRINSKHFSKLAIKILSSMNIKIFSFENFIATPILSYSVIKMNTDIGIMITASHNHKTDNGYKVYWKNGAQIIEPHNHNIEKLIAIAPTFQDIINFKLPKKENINTNKKIINNIITSYFLRIQTEQLNTTKQKWSNINITYTPLHGVGTKYALRALNNSGFYNINIVKTQEKPDGLFPTISIPNPEEKNALKETIITAQKHNSDLALVNDPDADRLAVLIRCKKNNELIILNGNQIGILLGYYILKKTKITNKKALIISTIVSTRMISKLAHYYKAKYIETATGFPQIINAAIKDEKNNNSIFIFGFEEAFGYTIGNFVKDKDGICAAVRFAELFAYLKDQGKHPLELLDSLSIKHGHFHNIQWAKQLYGQISQSNIAKIMNFFKDDTKYLKYLNDEQITKKEYLKQKPSNNILIYYTKNNTRLIIRPSGTECKIKFYLESINYVTNKNELIMKKKSLTIKLNKMKKQLLNIINHLL